MLHTKRLTLHPFEDTDQEAMIRLLMNETIKETYMIPDFSSKEEAISMFQMLKEQSNSNHHNHLGIYLQDELIGFFNDTDVQQHSIELGYVIHPDHHNRGYASEALHALIDDLFHKGFQEILAGAFIENIASQKVMERCGMKKMDHQETIEYHGAQHICVYYKIEKNESL